METLKQSMVDTFRAIMDDEPSLVVQVVNGDNTCRALRTVPKRDGLMEAVTGRNDPETMTLRAVIEEIGTTRTGASLSVDDVGWSINDANPDSVNAIVELLLQKQRTA